MRKFALGVCLLTAAHMATWGATNAESRTLTLGTVNNAQNVSTRAMEEWSRLLSERTDGRWSIDVIPGGVLGGDREQLQQLSSGEIDLNLTSPVILQHVAPEYQCLEAEYIFEDEDHGLRLWRGDLGREISEAIKENYQIEIVGTGRRGARHTTANREVVEPADLENARIRVTNDLRARVFTAFGAQPAPLPLSELYGALRQGVFDAAEAPITTIYSMRLHEVQAYVNLTAHIWSYNTVLANSAMYEELGEDRAAFDETLSEALEWLYDAVAEEEEKAREAIEAHADSTIVEPDVAAFREIAMPVVAEYTEENCKPGLLEAVSGYAAAP